MNKIWSIIIILSIIYCSITNDLNTIGNVLISTVNNSFKIFIQISTVLLFWSGMFNIANSCNLFKYINKLFKPIMRLIYHNELKEEELDLATSVFVCNLIGLSQASFSISLSFMKEINNKYQDNYPYSVTTFIMLNVTCLQLIPTSIISLRSSFNGYTSIKTLLFIFIGTFISFIIGLLIDNINRLLLKRKYKGKSYP